ncbi:MULTISPECIES: DUF4340 domain-containing protein [unclassified Methylophaga]|uniref:DUF4340 domain-containing protein n=1 Tax=unclassified Methylophaga TaxID=2629249 RepID=UPI00259D2FCF|nr:MULTISPECIES: DUF4340 domain-containing protein [unclassified Methylophaga]|tara:strand:+ start:8225 stop:9109 length:885 start_codon:yes stop_codon:yes gene_type:complete
MKSSYFTNFILLLLVVGLFWFSQHNANQQNDHSVQLLTSLNPADINTIDIQQRQKNDIKLIRDNASWRLMSPYPAPVSQTRINLILSLLKTPVHGEFQPMDISSLAQFGLHTPSVIVSLNNESFALGDVEPISKRRYVLYQHIIYLIDDDVMPLLTASADSFIDNRLIAEHKNIEKLTLPRSLNNPEPLQLTLSNGQWQSDDKNLTSDALKVLIDSWQFAYATQVRKVTSAELMAKPGPQITLWLEGQKRPVSLIMQTTDNNLILTNQDLSLEYIFPMAMSSQLLPNTPTQTNE